LSHNEKKLLNLCLFRLPKTPKFLHNVEKSVLGKLFQAEIFRSSRLGVTIVSNSRGAQYALFTQIVYV